MVDIEKKFIGIGGEFLSPPSVLKSKLDGIKAIIFDWDGVFNDGVKDTNFSSSYSEGDAMGTNLLRFGFYLHYGFIPNTTILTGALNEISKHLTEREHFNHLYYKSINKGAAFEDFLKRAKIQAHEVAFCFDDVLDLPIAQNCGLRFYINSPGRPLFNDYITKNNLFDYKTGNMGGNNSVREVAELVLGLMGNYEEVIQNRLGFSERYSEYLRLRNSVVSEIIEWK